MKNFKTIFNKKNVRLFLSSNGNLYKCRFLGCAWECCVWCADEICGRSVFGWSSPEVVFSPSCEAATNIELHENLSWFNQFKRNI